MALGPVERLVAMRYDMLSGGGQCLAYAGHAAVHKRPVGGENVVSPPAEEWRVRRAEQSAQRRIDYVVANSEPPATLIEPAGRVSESAPSPSASG